MTTQAIVKLNNIIASEDKKALYLSVPFESASHSDISAYDELFAEYVLAQQQGMKSVIQSATERLNAMNKSGDELIVKFSELQQRLRGFTGRVTARLTHVSGNKFNIVYECRKERDNKRSGKVADNDIDLKAYALLVHSEINLKAI